MIIVRASRPDTLYQGLYAWAKLNSHQEGDQANFYGDLIAYANKIMTGTCIQWAHFCDPYSSLVVMCAKKNFNMVMKA